MSSALDIRRVFRAARHSYDGLRDAIRNPAAFGQELVIGAVLTPVALWLGEDALERAALIGSLVLVLIVELLNSAIETVVDRIGTEPNDLSGRAKDLGSAAVLLSLITVAVVWGLVLLG
jgi:diacylglycerol kinase (ATP)